MSVPDAAGGVVVANLETAWRTAELAMAASGLLGREFGGVSLQCAMQF
jgi:hypothetical protein